MNNARMYVPFNGVKIWKNDKGQFHRTDGPAVENVNGYKAWYQNDKLHRTDGPAIEYADGDKDWFVEGVNYSEEEYNNLSFMTENGFGTKHWKNSQGQYHRTDGPAVVYANGDKYWYQNGKRHRTDGPAIESVDGYKAWTKNDKLHRTDGPAVEFENGDKEWWVEDVKYTEDQFNNLSFMTENSYGDKFWKNAKGQLHRTNGPAIEYENGDKSWHKNDKLHRTNGPAIEWSNGGNKSWYKNDKLHRTDGPAVEWPDGDKEWYQNGKRHRTDGPAVENVDGYKEWWVEDVKYTEEEFNKIYLPQKNTTAWNSREEPPISESFSDPLLLKLSDGSISRGYCLKNGHSWALETGGQNFGENCFNNLRVTHWVFEPKPEEIANLLGLK